MEFERVDVYYDLHVPGEEHYLADGMWSHNTGKSRACLEKLLAMALQTAGFRGLIIRKTKASLGATALKTWTEHVAKEFIANQDMHYFGGSDQKPPGYYLRNGSEIHIGGMDKATRIMSSEYDAIFVQEAIELTEDDWEALTTRLRNGAISFQQIIGDTNPSTPTHWLKQRADKGQTHMVYCSHRDNPTLWNGAEWTDSGQAYLDVLDRLTGVRRARFLQGQWTAADGLVYDTYDPAVHLVDSFPIPDDWARYWAVDFGYTNPFVCQWWAQSPDDQLHLYREIYQTGGIVAAHAGRILNLVTDDQGQWTEPKPQAIVCDHDAEGRAQLEQHVRLPTKKANKKVIDGIQAMHNRLALRGDGTPGLVFHRGALVEQDPALVEAKKPTCTADEITGYVWPKGQDGKELKEQPVKVDDHGMDAARYMVAHLDLRKGRPRVRFV